MFGIKETDLIIIAAIIAIVFIGSVIGKVSSRKNRSKSMQKKVNRHPSYETKKHEGHDIFLSYATPDRAIAQAISEALHSLGWSVWWDRSIPPGKSFDQVIEAAIDSASCMIVLWSKSSASSDWVKTEASEGVKRQILVPVLIEDVKIPLEFRRIQAADLIGWNSSTSHQGFQNMVSSIENLLSK